MMFVLTAPRPITEKGYIKFLRESFSLKIINVDKKENFICNSVYFYAFTSVILISIFILILLLQPIANNIFFY